MQNNIHLYHSTVAKLNEFSISSTIPTFFFLLKTMVICLLPLRNGSCWLLLWVSQLFLVHEYGIKTYNQYFHSLELS